MKKEIKIAVLVLIGFLSFLWLEKPTREFLSLNYFDPTIAKKISGIAIRLILVISAVYLINKLHLREFNGISSLGKFKNIHALILPLAFISMGFFNNWDTYISTDLEILSLFILSTIIIGIVEELIFRGTIFPLFIIALSNNKRSILNSAILSSLMFGAVHFVNLFEQPDNLIGITSQVFFALSIGVFFCGLMTRTENILIPIFLHALINFSFGAGELSQVVEESTEVISSTEINWKSIIPTTIFFTFIFLSGVYMILKSSQKDILIKLRID